MRQREKSNNNNRRGGGWHGIKEKRKDFLVYKDSCAQEGGEDVNIHKFWEFVAPSLSLSDVAVSLSLVFSDCAIARGGGRKKISFFNYKRPCYESHKSADFLVCVCPPRKCVAGEKAGKK